MAELPPQDYVVFIKADKQHECAYAGQSGQVVAVLGSLVRVHLKCGHVWDFPPALLERCDGPPPPPEPPAPTTADDDDAYRYEDDF